MCDFDPIDNTVLLGLLVQILLVDVLKLFDLAQNEQIAILLKLANF